MTSSFLCCGTAFWTAWLMAFLRSAVVVGLLVLLVSLAWGFAQCN